MAKSTSFYDWELGFRGVGSHSFGKQIDGYLKRYVGKQTLYRAVMFLEDDMKIENNLLKEGILTCLIDHSPYPIFITIDVNEWKITHDCIELEKVNELSLHKRFCSHLTKLFLILKEKFPKVALVLLEHISTHDYSFIY
jgi:hypothetical protein